MDMNDLLSFISKYWQQPSAGQSQQFSLGQGALGNQSQQITNQNDQFNAELAAQKARDIFNQQLADKQFGLSSQLGLGGLDLQRGQLDLSKTLGTGQLDLQRGSQAEAAKEFSDQLALQKMNDLWQQQFQQQGLDLKKKLAIDETNRANDALRNEMVNGSGNPSVALTAQMFLKKLAGGDFATPKAPIVTWNRALPF